MRSRTRALWSLALGLGLPGLASDAVAAPTTPPPPKTTRTRPATPAETTAPPRSTPPPPTASAPSTGAGTPSPPATPRSAAGPSSTPPPPPATAAGNPSPAPSSPEPELPPRDLSRTWGFSRSQPLTPRYARTDDPTYAAPNPVGFYSGVSVQGNHVPPFPAQALGRTPAVMTWTGFERAPEGSRVFFQLSADVAHEVTTDGLTLRIRMRNTRVDVRNNLRSLDLRYFETPVRTVEVRRRGRDTVATLVLEREAVPQVQIVDGKAGYKLLVVQFGDVTP